LSGLFPDRPKALVPVAGRPFLAWQLDWLFSRGFTSVLLAAGYLGDKIRDWVGQQSFRDKVQVFIEPALHGTGGGLKYLENMVCCDSFWAFNGDSLLPNLDFKLMEETHRKSVALATLAVTTMEDAARYGTILFDDKGEKGEKGKKGKIINFNEKGTSGPGWVNAGIYLLEPALLSVIIPGKPVSIEKEVFPKLVSTDKLFVFKSAPPLLDMGTPEGLKNMENYLLRK